MENDCAIECDVCDLGGTLKLATIKYAKEKILREISIKTPRLVNAYVWHPILSCT